MGLSKVLSNSRADEGLDSQVDMLALGLGLADLDLLHTTVLLESSLVGLDASGLTRQDFSLFFGHSQVAGGPVFHAAVWNTLVNPYPCKCTIRPLAEMETRSMGTLPWPSGLTRRFPSSWVSQIQS